MRPRPTSRLSPASPMPRSAIGDIPKPGSGPGAVNSVSSSKTSAPRRSLSRRTRNRGCWVLRRFGARRRALSSSTSGWTRLRWARAWVDVSSKKSRRERGHTGLAVWRSIQTPTRSSSTVEWGRSAGAAWMHPWRVCRERAPSCATSFRKIGESTQATDATSSSVVSTNPRPWVHSGYPGTRPDSPQNETIWLFRVSARVDILSQCTACPSSGFREVE